MESAQYTAGYCGSGRAERRRYHGYAGVAYLAAIGYLAAVLALDATPLLIGLVVPIALGTEWFLQARQALCSHLDVLGRVSRDSSRESAGGDPRCATRRAEHRGDRRRALVVTLSGLVTGTVVTGAVALLLWVG